MARLRIEVTVEPFVQGEQGPHVLAAIEAMRSAGLHPDVGPFGTSAEGDTIEVAAAAAAVSAAAFAAGATGVAISIQLAERLTDAQAAFLDALRPVARAVRGVIVAPERMRDGDVPLSLQGRVVGAMRLAEGRADLQGALDRVIDEVEAELGGRLAELTREDKQRAAFLLDERGAFHLRNAVDDVADAMGVSRVTVYNYLNALRSSRTDRS